MPLQIKMLRPASYPLSKYTPAKANYGYQHRQWRRQVLLRNPVCQCGDRATQAHHVKALSDGGEPFSLDNAASCCASCHSKITWRENHGKKG